MVTKSDRVPFTGLLSHTRASFTSTEHMCLLKTGWTDSTLVQAVYGAGHATSKTCMHTPTCHAHVHTPRTCTHQNTF